MAVTKPVSTSGEFPARARLGRSSISPGNALRLARAEGRRDPGRPVQRWEVNPALLSSLKSLSEMSETPCNSQVPDT